MSQGSYGHQNPFPLFSSDNLCASFTLQLTLYYTIIRPHIYKKTSIFHNAKYCEV